MATPLVLFGSLDKVHLQCEVNWPLYCMCHVLLGPSSYTAPYLYFTPPPPPLGPPTHGSHFHTAHMHLPHHTYPPPHTLWLGFTACTHHLPHTHFTCPAPHLGCLLLRFTHLPACLPPCLPHHPRCWVHCVVSSRVAWRCSFLFFCHLAWFVTTFSAWRIPSFHCLLCNNSPLGICAWQHCCGSPHCLTCHCLPLPASPPCAVHAILYHWDMVGS